MMPNCKEARAPCFLRHALVTHDDSNWKAKIPYGQLAAMDELWSCCLNVECSLWFLVPNRKQALPDSGQGLAPLPGLSENGLYLPSHFSTGMWAGTSPKGSWQQHVSEFLKTGSRGLTYTMILMMLEREVLKRRDRTEEGERKEAGSVGYTPGRL